MVNSILSGYTRVDLAIFIFLVYHASRGYIKGVRYIIFDTVKFFGSYFLTKVAYQLFFESVNKAEWFQAFFKWTQNSIISILCSLFPIMNFFPWESIVFCLIVFLGFVLLLRVALLGFKKNATFLQKIEGFLFGTIKGIAYLFVLIAILEPLIQSFSILGFSEWLQKSKILPYLYEYNFLLDFLSFHK